MADRELLELAAKAAGLTIDKTTTNGGGLNNTGFDFLGNAVLDWHNGTKWNPLTDDGDALRLASKCLLGIEWMATNVRAYGLGTGPFSQHVARSSVVMYADFDNDVGAATRRAIVRAAAEIGKAMQ